MATPSPPASPEGFSDSDHAWLQRLRGQPGPLTDSEALREADALGFALKAERRRQAADPELAAATTAPALQVQWQALDARLQAEGLLAPTTAPAPATPAAATPPVPTAKPASTPAPQQPAPSRWARLWPGRAGGPAWWPAASALALTALLLAVLVPGSKEIPNADLPEATLFRGAPSVAPQAVPQPRQSAEALAAALRQAGLKPLLSRRERSVVVDVELTADDLAAATPALRALAIEPRVGLLRVEFTPR